MYQNSLLWNTRKGKSQRCTQLSHSTQSFCSQGAFCSASLWEGSLPCPKGNNPIPYKWKGLLLYLDYRPNYMQPILNFTGRGFVFPFLFTIFAVIRFDILLANRLLLLSIPPRCEMRRVFSIFAPIKSNEYGTSKPPPTLHHLRCRNTRHDDSHLGNTRNYLLLQTQRLQVPNEGRS